MKTTSLFTGILVSCFCCQLSYSQKNNVWLSVNLTNAKHKIEIFSSYRTIFSFRDTFCRSAFVTDKGVTFAFFIPKGMQLEIGVHDTTIKHFATRILLEYLVEPGDSVNIRADANDIANTIECTGRNAEKYRLLNEYHRISGWSKYNNFQFNHWQRIPELIDSVKNLRINRSTFLDHHPTLPASLKRYLQADIDYWSYNFEISILMGKYQYDPSQLSFYHKDVINDSALVSRQYGEFLRSYLFFSELSNYKRYTASRSKGERSGALALADEYYLSKILFDGESQYVVLTDLLKQIILHPLLDTALMNPLVLDYKYNCPSTPESRWVINSYERALERQQNKTAPNFTLPDINGHMVSLSDFRGKVVFLTILDSRYPEHLESALHNEYLYQLTDKKNLVFFLHRH